MTTVRIGIGPPLPASAYLRRPQRPLPFPLDDARCRLFGLGRHALWSGLRAEGIGEGHAVLTSAYHHGSEVEAIERTGARCLFYDATESLEPDADELERLLAPEVRALHLVHYLGMPQDSLRWRSWCDERGLLLIEDAAQAWLAGSGGSPTGALADIALYSLYKSVGVPDGGALFSRRDVDGAAGSTRLELRELAHCHRSWLMQRLPRAARVAAAVRPPRRRAAYDPVADFALGDPATPISRTTRFLLPRLATAAVARSRRENYELLLDALRRYVLRPFDRLPAGASPMAFPIGAERKGEVIAALRAEGIRAGDLWAVPHTSLPVEGHPGAAARRAATVLLPVHQELRARHLRSVIDAVLRLDPAPPPGLAVGAR